MRASPLRLGLVGLIGVLMPLWWTWLVGVLIYGFFLAAGSPAKPTAGFGTALIVIPSAIVGMAAGTATTLLSPSAPIQGWLMFIASAVLGILAFALASSSLDGASGLIGDLGTWVFAGATFIPALFARLIRKGDG